MRILGVFSFKSSQRLYVTKFALYIRRVEKSYLQVRVAAGTTSNITASDVPNHLPQARFLNWNGKQILRASGGDGVSGLEGHFALTKAPSSAFHIVFIPHEKGNARLTTHQASLLRHFLGMAFDELGVLMVVPPTLPFIPRELPRAIPAHLQVKVPALPGRIARNINARK
jgi:hypothetical protein